MVSNCKSGRYPTIINYPMLSPYIWWSKSLSNHDRTRLGDITNYHQLSKSNETWSNIPQNLMLEISPGTSWNGPPFFGGEITCFLVWRLPPVTLWWCMCSCCYLILFNSIVFIRIPRMVFFRLVLTTVFSRTSWNDIDVVGKSMKKTMVGASLFSMIWILSSLVGGWATPLKNMKVNWDDYIWLFPILMGK